MLYVVRNAQSGCTLLFAYAIDGHCYVSKQPKSGLDVRQMIEAFEVQDIGCIVLLTDGSQAE